MQSLRASLLLTLATSAAGCVGNCGSSSSRASEAPDVRTFVPLARDGGREHPLRPMRRNGFTALVLRAGREAPLTPEQKDAVSDIQQKLVDDEPPFTALMRYQTDLVTQIRDGNIDLAKLEPDFAAIEEGRKAREAEQADALDAMHEALDKRARQAVVAAARARLGAMFRPRLDLLEAGVEGGAATGWARHRQNRVKVELGLDESQVSKVASMLDQVAVSLIATEMTRETIRKHADDMLGAFEQDTFDAHKLDLSPTGGKESPLAALEREQRFLVLLLPILTAEQREKLAVIRGRRVLGRWTAEGEPWSPFDEPMEPIGPRR